MSKKPHHLDGLSNILGSLKGEVPPPSPAPVVIPALAASPQAPGPAEPEMVKPVGRPKSGKKSDTRYKQTSILIMDETRTQVKHALLRTGGKQDMSQLVQSLLEKWLESQS